MGQARAWPEARYIVVPDAGHSALEPGIRSALVNATESYRLSLTDDDLFVIDGPLNPTRLMTILEGEHDPELHDSHFVAPVAPALQDATDLFTAIRQRDVLLHHPYDNFDSVVLFLQNAAADPRSAACGRWQVEQVISDLMKHLLEASIPY